MPLQEWQFALDRLVINASRGATRGTVTWSGVSDSQNPGVLLRPILQDVLDKMKGAEVTVDFTRLSYMNSATVSPLIQFVKALDTASSRALVVFADSDWQRTHLQCMRAIATTLKHVTVESAPAPPPAAG
jgi:hypothetical protein